MINTVIIVPIMLVQIKRTDAKVHYLLRVFLLLIRIGALYRI